MCGVILAIKRRGVATAVPRACPHSAAVSGPPDGGATSGSGAGSTASTAGAAADLPRRPRLGGADGAAASSGVAGGDTLVFVIFSAFALALSSFLLAFSRLSWAVATSITLAASSASTSFSLLCRSRTLFFSLSFCRCSFWVSTDMAGGTGMRTALGVALAAVFAVRAGVPFLGVSLVDAVAAFRAPCFAAAATGFCTPAEADTFCRVTEAGFAVTPALGFDSFTAGLAVFSFFARGTIFADAVFCGLAISYLHSGFINDG